MKVVSVRVNEALFSEINEVMWWKNLNKSDAVRFLLKLGLEAWERKKLETLGIKK